MEKPITFTQYEKSYEKELRSEEPFVRGMYENLEKRIEQFEKDLIEKNTKVKLKDFLGVSVVMAVITIIAFTL
ncbi:hypothetical protein QI30_02695 [Kurthia sp. 3B1D]|uniref:Uncharacterized protein n=1 Tax=Candidatus Kurthia intestinigallinarum TaxID=1562256 RepID=A0A433RXQ6_9BACL|nr:MULTISPECIES: hypothetical protein [unclassified Kurthia]RUS58074.1 hypothetical protein QI30_02695 [Kurthia sp. 3B1D]